MPPVAVFIATNNSRKQGRWALPPETRGPSVCGGDGAGWTCDQCQVRIDTVKAVNLHMGGHGVATDHIVFKCRGCHSYSSCNHRSVISHYRYCKLKRGDSVPVSSDIASNVLGVGVGDNDKINVSEEGLPFSCSLCTCSFKSKSGRSQHMRWKHPEAYNEGLTISTSNILWNK